MPLRRGGVSLRLALAPLALLGTAGCVSAGHHYPEAAVFAVTADPQGEVDAALARAAANDTRLLLVLGANWCHDSRALAGWLETEPFQQLVADHYELVFVNVGLPQSGDGHNLEVARRFGHELEGTPNLLVVTPEGTLVNGDTAASWRNTSTRSEDAIRAELLELAERPV